MIDNNKMLISICFIQYNRIKYLLESLKIIEKQTYDNIEIIISDDCSTDDTEIEILKLSETYKFPIVYSRSEKNLGYDRNYRRCVELGSGDYCFVLGNDDTLVLPSAIEDLVRFLGENNYPEIGFTNYFEFATPNEIVNRASATKVLGSGIEIALKYYNCFSFVGGLIYKKETFNLFNSDKHDGSIYAQMYLGTKIVAGGFRLFSISEPIVGKDIIFDNKKPNSYRDNISKKWKDFKVVDGGLPSVIHVMLSALESNNIFDKRLYYTIFKRIYFKTFPYWVLNYKYNSALPAAVGLVIGMYPLKNKDFKKLLLFDKIKIQLLYLVISIISLSFPSSLFFKFQNRLYSLLKR